MKGVISAAHATRIAFFIGGFAVACWAPLVPFAKERLHVSDSSIGALLLCLGTGSVLAMVLTGALNSKFGSRPLIFAGCLGLILTLPTLALSHTGLMLALALLAFGASLGVLDVAMNIHGTEVERLTQRPLMAGFHAFFSIGGFAGAITMTALLANHLQPVYSTLTCSVFMIVLLLVALPGFVKTKQAESEPLFAIPHDIVLLLSCLTAIAFLAEGAMLDWGALLVIQAKLLPVAQAGMGYMLFSIAMTLGRLVGDRITHRLGTLPLLIGGSALAILGIAVLLVVPIRHLALSGFVLIGLGIANIAPVLFRQAGKQTLMPTGLAIATLTTIGYAGVLLGPAGIGFAASLLGLKGAFWLLAALLALIPLYARRAVRSPH